MSGTHAACKTRYCKICLNDVQKTPSKFRVKRNRRGSPAFDRVSKYFVSLSMTKELKTVGTPFLLSLAVIAAVSLSARLYHDHSLTQTVQASSEQAQASPHFALSL